MSANTSPIFPLTIQTGFVQVVGTSANTAMDGTGTVSTIVTAGSSGTFVQKIRVKALGSNASSSVMRIFINNGSAQGTASNNVLFGELAIPITTASNSAPLPELDYVMNIPLKAGYNVNVCFGTSGSAGWSVSAVYADY